MTLPEEATTRQRRRGKAGHCSAAACPDLADGGSFLAFLESVQAGFTDEPLEGRSPGTRGSSTTKYLVKEGNVYEI